MIKKNTKKCYVFIGFLGPFKGGSRGFIFGTITFEITYVQCTRVVCTIFKGILRLLGQIVFFGGHIGGFKTLRKKKSTITRNQNWWLILDRYWFPDHNGSKFFKICQKLTELWSFKEIRAITKLPLLGEEGGGYKNRFGLALHGSFPRHVRANKYKK